jgi:hypothetical protein
MTEEERNSYWFYQIETRLKLNLENWADKLEFVTNIGQWCILKDTRYDDFKIFHCCSTDVGPRLRRTFTDNCSTCKEEIPEDIGITLEMMNK